MIKRLKNFKSDVLINNDEFRGFVENFESEILRGISTLSILTIIKQYDQEGIYGYQLLHELEEQTNKMLIVEEGTLYPMLKKLEKQGIIESKKKRRGSRPRIYYHLTDYGYEIYNHLIGFYSKLSEAIAPLMDFEVNLEKEDYIYCPNCANKIDLSDPNVQFCIVCGYNIQNRIDEKNGGN
ncbi:MAG: hypothetical protein GF364_05420 [Candidatus Lokiarchaeota archaeon]|nr:hypothetical protein [Candidatus Lokiarchaeota archaeon]